MYPRKNTHAIPILYEPEASPTDHRRTGVRLNTFGEQGSLFPPGHLRKESRDNNPQLLCWASLESVGEHPTACLKT